MKAAVYRQYGPPSVVGVEEVPKPEPSDHEVLVKVRASTVNSADARLRSLRLPRGFGLLARPVLGFLGPRKKILGTEIAGEIVVIGKAVTKFKVGDRVFAFPGIAMGGHAEYRVVPEDGCILTMPANTSFEAAAAISFGGTTALHFLRGLAKLQRGEAILIVGGSGTVGSAAVQLAKYFGAQVTAVTSTANIDCVRRLGADHVIDYTKTDYLRSGTQYDVILDTVGNEGHDAYRQSLTGNGRLLLCAADVPQMLGAVKALLIGKQRVFVGTAPERVEDLKFLRELVASGQFKPLIDQCFPLEGIAAAHGRVDSGRKRGSVVIVMHASAHSGPDTWSAPC